MYLGFQNEFQIKLKTTSAGIVCGWMDSFRSHLRLRLRPTRLRLLQSHVYSGSLEMVIVAEATALLPERVTRLPTSSRTSNSVFVIGNRFVLRL